MNEKLLDACWKMYAEHSTHLRHHETQRSTVAGTLIAIAAALVGLITFDKSITSTDAPATLFLIALGLFGAVFSAKQWERSSMHMQRARHYREKIDEVLEGTVIKEIKVAADKVHKGEFPRLNRLRLHAFWISLYVLIAVLGSWLSYVALCAPIHAAP